MAQPFRITAVYSLVSLLGIALVAVVLGAFLRWTTTQALESQQTRANLALGRTLVHAVYPEYVDLFARARRLSPAELRRDPRLGDLHREITEKIEGLDVVKVKILTPDGRTVFSTNPDDIGEAEDGDDALQRALDGRTAGGMVDAQHNFGSDRSDAGKQLVTAYLPVRSDAGEVLAALELYVDVTPMYQALRTTSDQVLGVTVALFLVLYLFLVTIVWRGDRVIRRHEHAERRLREDRIQYLAHHDSLTALPNRAQFSELLQRAVSRAQRNDQLMAVLVVGLDRFKSINDSLGHDAGDAVLIEAAQRLRHHMRQGEPVCRIGGDEFAVILENLPSAEHVSACAARIVGEFQSEISVGNQSVVISPSVGVAVYPNDGPDVEGLAKDADAAMHRAKRLGGNRFVFYTRELNERALERHELEMRLRRALQQDEFRLRYQPKVDAQTHRVMGMEALLRWQHPERGQVGPGEFIPVLEDSGLIIPVGEWVLREACRQCKHWHDSGFPHLRLSVNLSLQQFKSDTLIEDVKRIIDETGLAATSLELELTESVLIHDTEQAAQTLDGLKRLGVYISVDDFGTGYSSLSYLTRFPVDFIKIDRSFVRDALTNPRHRAITTAITAMARSMRIGVIAEGVETAEQLRFVTALGSGEIQGFVFSPALTASEFEQILIDPDETWANVFEKHRTG